MEEGDHRVRMFQNISKKKRKTVEMITNVSCFPTPKEKYPKTSPTNYVVIRGERLSFPRKIKTVRDIY